MEQDILRITTLPDGKRVGVSLFSDNSTYDTPKRNLLNSLISLNEYSLDNIENLPDGDYQINLFKSIPYAASFVRDCEPIPTCKAKPLLRYKEGSAS
jgi:hypothetical protein